MRARSRPAPALRSGPKSADGRCCAIVQTFFCIASVFLWPVVELFGDPRRNSALLRIGFDVFDHLDFGLAETADQLAGFDRRRMPFARRFDQLAAFFRLFAQRGKSHPCSPPGGR